MLGSCLRKIIIWEFVSIVSHVNVLFDEGETTNAKAIHMEHLKIRIIWVIRLW